MSKVRMFVDGSRDCLLAIVGFDHFKSRARQQVAQDLATVLLVLDDENALASAWGHRRQPEIEHRISASPSTAEVGAIGPNR
jgi:hypothetical protein